MTSKRDTMAKDLKKAITAENNKISEQVANQTNNITALTSSIDSLKRKSKNFFGLIFSKIYINKI